jgi:hypothetical protein
VKEYEKRDAAKTNVTWNSGINKKMAKLIEKEAN